MKLKKKAFSMIELLFAMIIMAALAAIAIPSMSSGTDSATGTSMRSDTINMANLLSAKIVEYPNITDFIGADGITFTDDDNDGIADQAFLDNETYPRLSEGNNIEVDAVDCSGNGGEAQGFYIHTKNPNHSSFEIEYDSCNNGKIIIHNY